jgi:hypothetical protein
MADCRIVNAFDAEGDYAGTDVPAEFRRVTDELRSEQVAVTLIGVSPHCFEQGAATATTRSRSSTSCRAAR